MPVVLTGWPVTLLWLSLDMVDPDYTLGPCWRGYIRALIAWLSNLMAPELLFLGPARTSSGIDNGLRSTASDSSTFSVGSPTSISLTVLRRDYSASASVLPAHIERLSNFFKFRLFCRGIKQLPPWYYWLTLGGSQTPSNSVWNVLILLSASPNEPCSLLDWMLTLSLIFSSRNPSALQSKSPLNSLQRLCCLTVSSSRVWDALFTNLYFRCCFRNLVIS